MTFLPEKYVRKINKMPTFYVFLGPKKLAIPELAIPEFLYFSKKLTKLPYFT